MFGKRRKNHLFGLNIEPSCAYCENNAAKEGEDARCVLKKTMSNGKCRNFSYDPLMRVPLGAPEIQKDRYSEDDFKL